MHRFLSVFIALGAVAALIFSLLWFQKSDLMQPSKTVVRQISVAAPPPPPPPPPAMQQNQTEATPSINLAADGAGPDLQFTEVQLSRPNELADLAPPEINNMSANFLDSLNVDWQAFGLEELDGVPRLLTDNFKIKYPQSLVRRGIKVVELELNVLIEETGKVQLLGLANNPYPELEPLVKKLMQKARFTTPKKDGVPVRAEFTWLMEFANS